MNLRQFLFAVLILCCAVLLTSQFNVSIGNILVSGCESTGPLRYGICKARQNFFPYVYASSNSSNRQRASQPNIYQHEVGVSVRRAQESEPSDIELSDIDINSEVILVYVNKDGEEEVLGKQDIRFVKTGSQIVVHLRTDQLASTSSNFEFFVAIVALSAAVALCYLEQPACAAFPAVSRDNTNILEDNNSNHIDVEAVQVNPVVPVDLETVAVDNAVVQVAPVLTELSHFSEISKRKVEAIKSGKKVLDLSVGEQTNSPPQQVLDALIIGAKKILTRYTSIEGLYELREACRKDFVTRKNIFCQTDQIVVSQGAKHALAQAILAVVSPGSYVIIPIPHWPVFPDLVRMAGAIPISAPTYKMDNYNLRPDVLKELLAKHQVSCLLLCNPNNPTGSVPSREHLLALAKMLRDYPDVMVITDESYERIVYDGVKHTSFATIPGMEDRTITVTGPSKAFCMTGLRIGFSVSPPEIASRIAVEQSRISNCASSIAQHAAIAIYSEGATRWLNDNVKELQRKRDLCVSLLKAKPKLLLPFNVPQGAYFLFLDVSAFIGKYYTNADGESIFISDSTTLCIEFLKVHQVAVMPGKAFGMDDHIRLHFGVSKDVLREVIVRLKTFLAAFKI